MDIPLRHPQSACRCSPKRCTPRLTAQVWQIRVGFFQKQACFLAFTISFAKNQLSFKKKQSVIRKIKLNFGKNRLFFQKQACFLTFPIGFAKKSAWF
jgi:hypothetical protein